VAALEDTELPLDLVLLLQQITLSLWGVVARAGLVLWVAPTALILFFHLSLLQAAD
jgi:hypothetical protein